MTETAKIVSNGSRRWHYYNYVNIIMHSAWGGLFGIICEMFRSSKLLSLVSTFDIHGQGQHPVITITTCAQSGTERPSWHSCKYHSDEEKNQIPRWGEESNSTER